MMNACIKGPFVFQALKKRKSVSNSVFRFSKMKNILKANVGRSVNLPKGQLFSKRWENEKRILKQILFFVFLARVRETARDTPLTKQPI